eukprot:5392523-Lingulodinium_polyedra.AAC.1
MMRSNRPSAAKAARTSRASCTPCEHHFWWCSHGVCEACDARAVVAAPKQHPSSARSSSQAARK